MRVCAVRVSVPFAFICRTDRVHRLDADDIPPVARSLRCTLLDHRRQSDGGACFGTEACKSMVWHAALSCGLPTFSATAPVLHPTMSGRSSRWLAARTMHGDSEATVRSAPSALPSAHARRVNHLPYINASSAAVQPSTGPGESHARFRTLRSQPFAVNTPNTPIRGPLVRGPAACVLHARIRQQSARWVFKSCFLGRPPRVLYKYT